MVFKNNKSHAKATQRSMRCRSGSLSLLVVAAAAARIWSSSPSHRSVMAKLDTIFTHIALHTTTTKVSLNGFRCRCTGRQSGNSYYKIHSHQLIGGPTNSSNTINLASPSTHFTMHFPLDPPVGRRQRPTYLNIKTTAIVKQRRAHRGYDEGETFITGAIWSPLNAGPLIQYPRPRLSLYPIAIKILKNVSRSTTHTRQAIFYLCDTDDSFLDDDVVGGALIDRERNSPN